MKESRREREREREHFFKILFAELDFNKIEFYMAFCLLPPWHKAHGTQF